ncbi:hypothetical protein COOONC_22722 [Cooperia oncophora]
MDEEHEFAFNEELERTLLEAEKHRIAEDDESSDELSLSAQYQDSGRENSLSSARSKEAETQSKISEEELPSTSGGDDARRSVMSSAERKAEMIRQEKAAQHHDEEDDFINDDDSDPMDGFESDNETTERRPLEDAHQEESSDEEILPSDAEEMRPAEEERLPGTQIERTCCHPMRKGSEDQEEEKSEKNRNLLLPTVITVPATADSERPATANSDDEEILPSDDEEPSNHVETHSDDEEVLPSDDEEPNSHIETEARVQTANHEETPPPAEPEVDDYHDREEILPSDDEELEERARAATKIQAAYRGHRTRKALKKEPSVVIEPTNEASEEPTPAEENNAEEEAPLVKSDTPRLDTPIPKRPENVGDKTNSRDSISSRK